MTQPVNKAHIFRTAWQIARTLATAAGTGPRAQFGVALREAYAKARQPAAPSTATLTFLTGKGRHRAWLAKVTGKDARFGFARQFLRGAEFYDNGPKVRFDVELVEGEAFEDHAYGYYVVRGGALTEVADKAAFSALFA